VFGPRTNPVPDSNPPGDLTAGWLWIQNVLSTYLKNLVHNGYRMAFLIRPKQRGQSKPNMCHMASASRSSCSFKDIKLLAWNVAKTRLYSKSRNLRHGQNLNQKYPGFESMFSDLSGFESECRFQNAVDSLPCQRQSFCRVSWISAARWL